MASVLGSLLWMRSCVDILSRLVLTAKLSSRKSGMHDMYVGFAGIDVTKMTFSVDEELADVN